MLASHKSDVQIELGGENSVLFSRTNGCKPTCRIALEEQPRVQMSESSLVAGPQYATEVWQRQNKFTEPFLIAFCSLLWVICQWGGGECFF